MTQLPSAAVCCRSALTVKLGSNALLEPAIQTLTAEDVARQPQRLLDAAARGELSMVTQAGEPLLLAVPLGAGLVTRELLLELAAVLYKFERIGLGLAAKIAGLSNSEMIDGLGRREIAVRRMKPGELGHEVTDFGT